MSATVFGLLALALVQQISVSASVNANRIGVEDVLQLTVSVSGGESTGEPELPSVQGFRVGGRSTSSQIQIVNGQMTSTRSYIYQLLPQREGRFTIDPVRVSVAGRTEETDPITVEVVAGSVLPSASRSGRRSLDPFDPFGSLGRRRDRSRPELEEDDVFVRAEVSKRSVFQGEQLVVTYRLFSRYMPLGPEVEDDPPLEGFWVEEVDLGAEYTVERRTVEGKRYIVFPIKQRVLFPTASGKLVIPPVTFSTAFRLTSSDPFDSFFARASAPVTVRSSPIELDVKPLPAEGRGDFEGAVGQFDLEAVLSQEAVEAGDPVTLTLSVEGSGNLRRIEPVDLPELAEFRAFAPKTDERARAGAGGLSGRKTWEYVLVPESGGVKELGPFSFQYFDPDEARYVTASAGPLELDVEGAALSAVDLSTGASGARGEVTVLREDIRYLKDPPARLGSSEAPFHRSGLFYLSLLLPVLWNLAFVGYRKRQEKERTHSHVFRSRRAQRMARERLKQAGRLEAAASRDFYEEVAAALYRFVGDKLSVSPSGLTSSSIDEHLEAAGVPGEIRQELLSLLDACEEARFTPGTRTREEMAPLRARAEDVIVSLARHWK